MIPIFVSIWFSYFFVFLLPLNEFPFISIIFILLCFLKKNVLFPFAVNITFDEFNDRELLSRSIIIYFWPFWSSIQQESTTIKTPEENTFFFKKKKKIKYQKD